LTRIKAIPIALRKLSPHKIKAIFFFFLLLSDNYVRKTIFFEITYKKIKIHIKLEKLVKILNFIK